MRRTPIVSFSLCNVLVVVALLSGACGQEPRQGFPLPPGPAVRPDEPTHKSRTLQRLDTVAMEREARELSTLAGTIPGDVDQLKKGLLPRDAKDKLKRIEKLAKQLRAQIQP